MSERPALDDGTAVLGNVGGAASVDGVSTPTSGGSQQRKKAIPVTLLSGFLGAGKTTLLRHLVTSNASSASPLRVALVVNDMASLNVDARMVRSVTQVEEQLVEMHDGCICCTLREDLLVELKKLADAGRFDYIIIESTGISEPQQVAETFAFEDENGVALNSWTELDTLVTVVDCVNFFDHLESEATVQDTREAVGEDDERNLSTLMVDQIEFANVICLNKCDIASDDAVCAVEAHVRALNPDAKVVRTTRSEVSLSDVLNTGSFDLDAAQYSPGWMQVMRGAPIVPETEEYHMSSFVYRRRRPFHPQRLSDLIERSEPLPGVVRSKGFAWLANHEIMVIWASAGRLYDMDPGAPWYATLPRDQWEDYVDHEAILKDFEEPHGDRRQELVIIGHRMDAKKVEQLLDDALMRPGEVWDESRQDPFEHALAIEDEDDGEEEEGDDGDQGGGDDDDDDDDGEGGEKDDELYHKPPHKSSSE